LKFRVYEFSPFAIIYKDKQPGDGNQNNDPDDDDDGREPGRDDDDDWWDWWDNNDRPDRYDDDRGNDRSRPSRDESMWERVERYIKVARAGEYVEVLTPHYIKTIPDFVLETLEKRRITLVITDSTTDREYILYGGDIYSDRLTEEEYHFSELAGLVARRSNSTSSDDYDRNPSTGGDKYIPISSHAESPSDTPGNYNPSTGGMITLFSNSRTIDPLPDIEADLIPSALAEHDELAMRILLGFFAVAAILPLVELSISGRKRKRLEALAGSIPRRVPAKSSTSSTARHQPSRPGTTR
jgi:hypothetical protein